MTAILRAGALAGTGLGAAAFGRVLAAWAIARWQGPQVQGAFGLWLAGASFGAVLLSIGLDYANAYVVGRDPTRLRSVVVNTLGVAGVALALGPLWAGAFLQFFPGVAADAEASWLAGVVTLAGATGLTVATQCLQAAMLGSQDIRGVAGSNLLTGVVWTLLAIVAASGFPAWYLMAAWTVGLGCIVVAQVMRLGVGANSSDQRAVLRDQLTYGVRTLPGGVARALNMRAAVYLGALYLSSVDLGVLVLYLSIAEALLYLPNAFGQVILAWTARRGANAPSYRSAYWLVGIVGGATCLCVLTVGDELIGAAMGAVYQTHTSVLAVLLAGTTAHALGLLRIHTMLGAGRPGATTVAQLITLAVTGVSMPLLVAKLGLMGAALGLLGAYCCFATYLFATPTSVVRSDTNAVAGGARPIESGGAS